MTRSELKQRAFVQAPNMVSRSIAGEHLLVPVRQGTAEMDYIYMANETGSLILRALDGRRDVSALTRLLCREFEVSEEQAYEDVVSFLSSLVDIGLICPAPEAMA